MTEETPPWLVHGGALAAAAAHFGQPESAWLDLSTGINPESWPGAASLAFSWRGLPDPAETAALERACADYLGVESAHVCALPGSETGLRLLGRLLPDSVCVASPGYGTHREMAPDACPVAPDALEGADGKTLVLANPANPQGLLRPRAAMEQLLAARGAGWLVVDEAFADACPDDSMAPLVNDGTRLVVLRSFGKFFGLAGLRLGFLLAPVAIGRTMRGLLGAWPVSTAAIAIGRAALRDRVWIGDARRRLGTRAARLDRILRRAGLEPRGECPLFRLTESPDAQAVFLRLAQRAILARPFSYAPRWLRFGLPGDDAGFARLEEALLDG